VAHDFIGFLIGSNLPEHQAHLGGKGADHVQRRSRRLARRPSARLAIDGDHLFMPQCRNHPRDPLTKCPFEALWIQYREDSLEGVGRGDAIVEAQKATQPRQLDAPPLADVLEVIRTAEDCADGNGQQLAQRVARLLSVAPVLKPLENLDHVYQLARFHRPPKKAGNYTKQRAVDRGWASG